MDVFEDKNRKRDLSLVEKCFLGVNHLYKNILMMDCKKKKGLQSNSVLKKDFLTKK